jgi:hypothetical protein
MSFHAMDRGQHEHPARNSEMKRELTSKATSRLRMMATSTSYLPVSDTLAACCGWAGEGEARV